MGKENCVFSALFLSIVRSCCYWVEAEAKRIKMMKSEAAIPTLHRPPRNKDGKKNESTMLFPPLSIWFFSLRRWCSVGSWKIINRLQNVLQIVRGQKGRKLQAALDWGAAWKFVNFSHKLFAFLSSPLLGVRVRWRCVKSRSIKTSSRRKAKKNKYFRSFDKRRKKTAKKRWRQQRKTHKSPKWDKFLYTQLFFWVGCRGWRLDFGHIHPEGSFLFFGRWICPAK